MANQNKSKLQLLFEEIIPEEENTNSINLKVDKGYWTINGKQLRRCSIAKKSFFDALVRMKLIKTEVSQESSFKNRAKEIKEKFNYKFANQKPLDFGNYPNIETIIFEPKN